MFEKNNKNKYGKIRKSDDRYSVAAGSGEPGSSLYGMKDFKSKTPHNVNPRASSTLNSIYGIEYDDENMKQAEVDDTKPILTASEVLQKALAESEKEERAEKIRNYKKTAKSAYKTGKTDDFDDIYTGGIKNEPEKKNTDENKTETKKEKVTYIKSKTLFNKPSFKEEEDIFDEDYPHETDNFKNEYKNPTFDDDTDPFDDSDDNSFNDSFDKNVFKDYDDIEDEHSVTPVVTKSEEIVPEKPSDKTPKSEIKESKKSDKKKNKKETKKEKNETKVDKTDVVDEPKNDDSKTDTSEKEVKSAVKTDATEGNEKEAFHFDFDRLKKGINKEKSPLLPQKNTKKFSVASLAKLEKTKVIPIAAAALFVVVAVSYAVLRVPLSKLGGGKVGLYGIELKPGILVNNTDISQLSNGKIKQLLGNGKLNTDDKLVTIKSSDNSYSIDYGFDEFDVVYDVEGTIQSAADFASDTTSDNWWRQYKSLEGGNVNFDVIHYNKSKLNSAVKAIATELEVPSVDATAKKVDDEFVVTKSSVGYTIDSSTIFTNVDKLIKERNFGQDVVFQLSEVQPRFNESNFSEIDNVIGSCTSEYSNSDADRVQNLKNACKKINGTILYPNEEFSTNEHFLPFTEKNGWRNAGTIVQGKIEDSMGGGMCQVSTALYDALLEAEVQITERYNHSLKVNYSEYGMDAALAGDYKDLCFKNDTDAPLYIEAYVTKSNVVINIYGKEIHNKGRRIEFESKLIGTTEPGDPIITYDDTLPEGTEKVTTSSLQGTTYELYKKIYENGELKETVKVNTSTYSPRREEKTIGTKKAD